MIQNQMYIKCWWYISFSESKFQGVTNEKTEEWNIKGIQSRGLTENPVDLLLEFAPSHHNDQ